MSSQTGPTTHEDFLERVHPADREFVKSTCEKAAREHEPFDFHYRALRPDGTVRNLHARGVVVIDEIGNPIRMFGSCQDVTELKQAEAELEESRDQLQTVLNAVPGGVSWISSDLRYLGINSYLARLLSLTPDQVIGQEVGFLRRNSEFDDFVHEFFATRARADEREVTIEVAGAPHIFLVMARKYEHGRGAVFVSVDITERKQATAALQQAHAALEIRVQERTAELTEVVAALRTEITEREHAEAALREGKERLRESEARLRTVVTSAPVILWATDREGVVTFSDGKGLEALGYSPGELVGQSIFDLYQDEPSLLDLNRRALAGEELAFSQDVDGVMLEVRMGPLRDQEDNIAGVLGVAFDITERKQAEAEAERAREEADRANRAKSEFLSRMSHELRTPLNAILGFTQLMALDERPPRERENLDYILKAGQHLLVLINEVLDIARIETGRMSFSIEPLYVPLILQEGIDLVRPLAADNHVQIHQDESCDRWILADRQRLKQVVLNLLSNAIKYNRPAGAVRLSCEVVGLASLDADEGAQDAGQAAAPEGHLRIQVSDTGLGISPEMQERLFTPFDRLGAEHSGIEGTGVGLALSKRIVEAMGGNIRVESTVGEGSTFSVEMPLTQTPLPAADTEAPEGLLETIPSVRALTILYIEDNLSNLRLIESILVQQPGIRLLAAMQGSLGLELARDQQPDAILLDLHLPDIPGDEILQRLKADQSTCSIPVIVLSADAIPSHIEQLLAGGAHAYLTKPLQVRQFLQVLEETFPRESPAA